MDPREQQPTPNEPQHPTGYPQQSQSPANQPPAATPEPQMTVPAFDTPAPEVPLRKPHKKLALTLLLAPTALIIISMASFMLASQVNNAAAQSDELFDDTPVAASALNVIGFVGGGIGVMTWLPGLIIGIILLARKK